MFEKETLCNNITIYSLMHSCSIHVFNSLKKKIFLSPKFSTEVYNNCIVSIKYVLICCDCHVIQLPHINCEPSTWLTITFSLPCLA